MNLIEGLILKWSKRHANGPWIITVQIEEGVTAELNQQEVVFKDYLTELLDNLTVTEYPFEYNMLTVSDKKNRMIYMAKFGNQIATADIDFTVQQFVQKQYHQTKVLTENEPVYGSEDLTYDNTLASMNNKAMRSANVHVSSVTPGAVVVGAEYSSALNCFWLFLDAKNVTANEGQGLIGYISGYGWPQGHEVPSKIGKQDLKNWEKAIYVDYLGVDAFSTNENSNLNKKKAGFYGIDPKIITLAGKESYELNKQLINNSKIIAVSLQYNAMTMKPITENDGRLIGVAYGTSYSSVENAQKALRDNTFKGVPINKELLKRDYSQAKSVQDDNPLSVKLPLVEYDGYTDAAPSDGLKTSSWVSSLSLKRPPSQTPIDGDKEKEEERTQEGPDSTVGPGSTEAGVLEDGTETTRRTLGSQAAKREDDKMLGYVNNAISFVPPYDDRLEELTIYGPQQGQKEELPYDYAHKVRIGDVLLTIPPLNIRMDKQYLTTQVETMRAKTPLQKQVGSTRNVLTMQLYFSSTEDINGYQTKGYTTEDGEVVPYYLDGLRPLIAQFYKAPFLPIDNEYINFSLNVHNVVLRNIAIESIPGFPKALKATLMLEEFDAAPYLMGETQLGALINYPLLRYHYQRSLHQPYLYEPWRTYLAPIEHMDNEFKFQIINEDDLKARKELLTLFRDMDTPKSFARDIKKGTDKISEETWDKDAKIDAENIRQVLVQYKWFLNERKTQKIAKEHDVKDKYEDIQNVPVVLGERIGPKYAQRAEHLDEKDLAYGRALAGKMYPKSAQRVADLNHTFFRPIGFIDESTANPDNVGLSDVPDWSETENYPARADVSKINDGVSVTVDTYQVIDGDTIEVTYGGSPNSVRVRMLMYDSPEVGHPNYNISTQALKRILDGAGKIRMDQDAGVPDDKKTDSYGRELWYVWADDTLVQETLLSQGHGIVRYVSSEYTKYSEALRYAQDYASYNKLEVWAGRDTSFTKNADLLFRLSSALPENGDSALKGYFYLPAYTENMKEKFRDYIGDATKNLSKNVYGTESKPNYLVIPALDVEDNPVVTMLNQMQEELKNATEQIEQYERQYNSIANRINQTEDEMSMVDWFIPDLVPISMAVGLENRFSEIQVQAAQTPTMQYFGSQAPEIQLTFETTENGVMAIESMLREVASYIKEYRDGVVSGFLNIQNPMIALMGIEAVVPINIQYDTVPNHPGRQTVTMTLSGFNKTQRRQEAIYGHTGGDPSEELKDRAYTNYDPAKDGRYVHERLKQIEVYPDLEMPKVEELNEVIGQLGAKINKYENYTKQVFLDPDFYVSTEITFRQLIQDYVHSDEEVEVRYQDAEGYVVDSKLKEGTAFNFVASGRTPDEWQEHSRNVPYAPSRLNWQNYKSEQQMKRMPIGATALPGSLNTAVDSRSTGSGASGVLPYLNADLEVKVDLITNSSYTGGNGNTRKGITLHDTGGTGSGLDAEWMSNYQKNMDERKSWHYQVDDKLAIQSFTHDTICWHAGDSEGNGSTIGIEMCVNKDGNYEQTISNVAKLMAMICYVEGFDPLKDISTHQDWSGKYCPEQILNKKNGITLQDVYDLTAQELTKLKQNNTQGGGGLDLIAEINNNAKVPSFTQWKTWEGNGAKTNVDYAQYTKEMKETQIDDTKLWFTLADSILKHFDGYLVFAESSTFVQHDTVHVNEEASIKERKPSMSGPLDMGYTTSYGSTSSLKSLEYYYTSKNDLGKIAWLNSDNWYNYSMAGYLTGDKLKNRDKSREDYSFWNKVGINFSSYDFKKIPFGRALVMLKSLIIHESNGIHFKSGIPVFKDKNADNHFTRVGIAGVKFNELSTPEEVARAIWDWRYNIDKVVEEIAKKFKQFIESKYNDIKSLALDWAIASRSNLDLPQVVTTDESKYDKPDAYNGNPIHPAYDAYYSSVQQIFNKIVKENLLENHAPMLYQGLSGQILKGPQSIYVGLPEDIAKKQNDNKQNESDESGTPSTNTGNSEDIDLSQEAQDNLEEAETEIINALNDHFPKQSLEERIKGMFVDMIEHDHTGRLLRAFPSFNVQIIDEGKWFNSFKMWDNFYAYNAIKSIDVYKSRKIVADTAIVEMSNMYGGLSTRRKDIDYPDFQQPSFFSSVFWENYVLGNPTEEVMEQRNEIYESMMLEAGARLSIRMGYGAAAERLPLVFNGVITEVGLGDVVTIAAQGDGLELSNQLTGNIEDKNSGLFGFSVKPRDFIGGLLTSKGNWFKDTLNAASGGFLFKDSPTGIVHFGASFKAEEGNIVNNGDFGDSMENVYSQNKSGQKTMFYQEESSDIVQMQSMLDDAFYAEMGWDAGTYKEDNIIISIYGKTPWDIIQIFTLCTDGYVSAVVPFEYRSTLFFGQPHWPMIYAYSSRYENDEATGTWVRSVTEKHTKTFMQAHIATSYNNIISNEIKASSEGVYNNVMVQYDGHQTSLIQADSDIRPDQQKTALMEVDLVTKSDNAFENLASNIVNGDWTERNMMTTEMQATVYGQTAVRDFIKDMYKGQYSILGDATVKPHDVFYLNDTVQDINGIHLTKAVHHSMSSETGFISIVEPDTFVFNFDVVMLFLSDKIFAMCKELVTRSGLAEIRPFDTKHARGIQSNPILSPVLAKLGRTIAAYGASNTLYNKVAGWVPPEYIIGIMKKTQGYIYTTAGRVFKSERLIKASAKILNNDNIVEFSDLNDIKNYAEAIVESWQNGGKAQYKAAQEVVDAYRDSSIIKKTKKAYKGLDKAEAIDDVIVHMVKNNKIMKEFADNVDDYRDYLTKYREATKTADALTDARRTYKAAWFTGKGASTLSTISTISVKVGTVAWKVLKSKLFWVMLADYTFDLITSSFLEMWRRAKQNAECVKIVPLKYKGARWTAGMSGSRGAVVGTTPSSADNWWNAQFGDDNEGWHTIFPKIMNFITNDDINVNSYHSNPEGERVAVYASTLPEDSYAGAGGGSGGAGGAVTQPTAQLFDQSAAAGPLPVNYANWNLAFVDKMRLNAADPPFVTGAYIDEFLTKYYPDSPLIGYGTTIKNNADYFGVAVGLFMGVIAKETTFGKNPCGGKYNFGCVTWSEGSPFGKKYAVDRNWIDPPTVESAIVHWFKYVQTSYVQKGVKTYKAFLDIYSPSFENSHSTFKNIMYGVLKSFGYDTSDNVSKTSYSNGSEDPLTFKVPTYVSTGTTVLGNYSGGALTYSGDTLSANHVQYIQGLAKRYNILPSLLITMLHYEGLWGSSNVARKDNNWGGMTWSEGYVGNPAIPKTKGSARPARETGYYIRYNSATDFFEDWVYLLRHQNEGGKYNVVGQRDLLTAAKGLFKQGGATANYADVQFTPVSQYTSSIMSRSSGINKANGNILNALDAGM